MSRSVAQVFAEYTADLEGGNIFSHMLKQMGLEDAGERYFYFVCPLLKAIERDIEEKGRLFRAPKGQSLFHSRGHGPVSFGNKWICRRSKNEHDFAVEVKVSVGERAGELEDEEVRVVKFTLSPPISLLKKFDQKVFDAWAKKVKIEREQEEKRDDLTKIRELVKRYRKEAKALINP